MTILIFRSLCSSLFNWC